MFKRAPKQPQRGVIRQPRATPWVTFGMRCFDVAESVVRNKGANRLSRPFRAGGMVVRKHTQGVALGYLRVPRWGVWSQTASQDVAGNGSKSYSHEGFRI